MAECEDYSDEADEAVGVSTQQAGYPLQLSGYEVYPWSTAGVETCVVVQTQRNKNKKKKKKSFSNLKVAFDIGYALQAATSCEHVFISHGHIDHVGGIVNHAYKCYVNSGKKATYYVPAAIEDSLREISRQYASVANETYLGELNIKAVKAGDEIPINHSYYAKPFTTYHRVPSLGYIVYKRSKDLKAEHRGKSPQEIEALVKGGEEVSIYDDTPEIAYTGDTNFELFRKEENPDLLRVKLLIMECTLLLDPKAPNSTSEKAHELGHIHQLDLMHGERYFKQIQDIVLIHITDRYSASIARNLVSKNLPESLRQKVHLGLMAKEIAY